MQSTGYVVVNGEKILVLARWKKFGVALKKRTSGIDGTHFSDEESYLNLPEKISKENLDKLLKGEVIHI